MANLKKQFQNFSFTEAAVFLVDVYQKIFSPGRGFFSFFGGTGVCRFFPSCSEYTRLSFRQYGLLRGSMVSLRRIFKCHPFHPGGYDPVES